MPMPTQDLEGLIVEGLIHDLRGRIAETAGWLQVLEQRAGHLRPGEQALLLSRAVASLQEVDLMLTRTKVTSPSGTCKCKSARTNP